MADPSPGYAATSLAPGPSPPWQPERRQITHPEVAYVSVGARHPPLTDITTDRTDPPPEQQVATNYAHQPLDSTYSQLAWVAWR